MAARRCRIAAFRFVAVAVEGRADRVRDIRPAAGGVVLAVPTGSPSPSPRDQAAPLRSGARS